MFCGSAFKNKGVQGDASTPLLSTHAGSGRTSPVSGLDDDDKPVERKGIRRPKNSRRSRSKIGDRPRRRPVDLLPCVFRASCNSGDTIYNPVRASASASVVCCRCTRTSEEIKEVRVGDIAAAVGLKEQRRATRCDPASIITLERMVFPGAGDRRLLSRRPR